MHHFQTLVNRMQGTGPCAADDAERLVTSGRTLKPCGRRRPRRWPDRKGETLGATTDFTIREYAADDWAAVCRVHDLSRPDELRGSFDARAFIPLAEDPEGQYINFCDMYIAQPGDDVVGFAGIDDPYLAWLYVDPAYYRRGIGRALLRHCLVRMSDDAWTRACGNNTAALGLYLSEGFVVVQRYIGENGGYKGPAARLALHPERRGWTRPKRSEAPGRQGAG